MFIYLLYSFEEEGSYWWWSIRKLTRQAVNRGSNNNGEGLCCLKQGYDTQRTRNAYIILGIFIDDNDW